MPDPLTELLEQLDLTALDDDLYLGDPGAGEGRLFGGHVAAQSLLAAGRTVSGVVVHSLHAYFLRPGRHDVPIRFVVDRIRDGRTFTTRHVVAYQGGEAIFDLSVSFTHVEPGIEHQDAIPDAPSPEGLPEWEEVRGSALGDPRLRRPEGAIEIRAVDPDEPGVVQPPHRRIWIRPAGVLPDDPLMHAAAMLYASDRTLLSTAARPHGLTWGKRMAASLDHAMWFHSVPRFNDWLLYYSESPVARSARGLIYGSMFARDGVRVASVVQEGLIRTARGEEPPREIKER
ncbi:MAG: acyl-CoA thioesterase [Tepidiformaceae bacterium]